MNLHEVRLGDPEWRLGAGCRGEDSAREQSDNWQDWALHKRVIVQIVRELYKYRGLVFIFSGTKTESSNLPDLVRN